MRSEIGSLFMRSCIPTNPPSTRNPGLTKRVRKSITKACVFSVVRFSISSFKKSYWNVSGRPRLNAVSNTRNEAC